VSVEVSVATCKVTVSSPGVTQILC